MHNKQYSFRENFIMDGETGWLHINFFAGGCIALGWAMITGGDAIGVFAACMFGGTTVAVGFPAAKTLLRATIPNSAMAAIALAGAAVAEGAGIGYLTQPERGVPTTQSAPAARHG